MRRILIVLVLAAVGCHCAPIAGSADTTSLHPEAVLASPSVASPVSAGALNDSAKGGASERVAVPGHSAVASDWKDGLNHQEKPSIVAPALGTALGIGVVALGIFCANSSAVENAFSSKPDAGHKAAVVTGSGIVLAGAAIIVVSLVNLKNAL